MDPRLLCSRCTNPSSPPVTVLSLQHLLDRLQDCLLPPPGFAVPAALAGRGPAVAPGSVEQPYASHQGRTGGDCVQPGCCQHPAGWQGDTCQTDVDECGAERGTCPPWCVNTVGSYRCQCWEGHSPSADGVLCQPKRGALRVALNPTTGLDGVVEEEVVQRLWSRVHVLERKLELLLAPLYSLASRALGHRLPDPGSFLAHSFQQLDRIDSLSEQTSFLEEQLGSYSNKKEL